jgi:hypothetical protein
MGPSMAKWTKTFVRSNPNFKYSSFQHKNKKVDSNFFLSLIMEASMLPLGFDELNTKF